MATAFNTNPSYLSHRLFTPHRPRIGANTYLNVNLLPDFVEYIKKNLTTQELLSLSEYKLQTYVTELSIKEKVTDSLQTFLDRILAHMRASKEFWMNAKIVKTKENEEKEKEQEKHQHEAIVQFQKDVAFINDKKPHYDQRPFNKVKKRRIQQSWQLAQNSHFIDKQKQILKLNLTNYSMMPAYVLREYLKEQTGVVKLQKHENLPKEDLELLHELQNCIEFFMMQQKPKVTKSQNVRRRELARERKLPAYLLEGVEQDKQIEEEIEVEAHSKESHSLMQQIINPNVLTDNPEAQLKIIQSEQSSSQQESQNEYYNKFQQQVSKKMYYDSRMFSKQITINQSHNMMEILRCLAYYISGQDQVWFEVRWRELEEQRVMREKRKKEEEDQSEESEDRSEQLQEEGKKEDKKQVENLENQPNYQDEQKQNQNIQMIHQSAQNQNEQKIYPQVQKIVQEKQPDQIQQECSEKFLQQKSLPQQIQIGTRKSVFNQEWKNPTTMSFKQLSRHFSQQFLSLRQIYFLTKQYLTRGVRQSYARHKQHSLKCENGSRGFAQALIDPEISLEDIAKDFRQMIEHPEHVKLSAFKTQGIQIPWDDKDYLLFLKGLLEFFFIPTNNRKIALYMMGKNSSKNIQANHVKYVKGIYLKNMSIRIERGEAGGGKKGRMQGKTEFIEKDVECFSMKYFDKLKKNKKKLRKRRFDDEVDAGEEADSAY